LFPILMVLRKHLEKKIASKIKTNVEAVEK